MAAWNVCTMLKFRAFSTFFRTPVLFRTREDKVAGVLLKLNRPKRPPTGFLRFLTKKRTELQAEHPGTSFTELTKIASKIWKEMPEEEKSPYNKEYITEMQEFKLQNNYFVKQLSAYKYKDEWKQESKRITEADKKIMGKPMQPGISFMSFCSFLKKLSPDLSRQEIIDKGKKKWKSSTDKDWIEYLDEIARVSEKYEKELLQWEENMFNKGYFQLVRPEILKIFQRSE